MKDKLYDNADGFAISFDEQWKNISCDDLAFDYNIDGAWWEHSIIPKNIYKYMGVTKNDIEVKPHVIIKSKDGKYTYCDTDVSPMM